MKPIFVGIAGPKRSGKDTTARILRHCLAEFDQDILVGQTSFADTIYDMLSVLVGHDVVERLRHSDEKDTEIIEPFGVTLRHLADTLGTEWGRDLVHRSLWVLALSNRAFREAALHDTPAVILVPDVRFPDEAQLIRDNGFLIHIQRDGEKHQSVHRSAIPLVVEDTDTVFQNTGTLEAFERRIYAYGRSTFQDDLAAIIRASTGVGRLLSE